MNFTDPMAQVIFNILVTICGLLGGYVLKSIQATLANMLREQRDLANKLQAIEVLVAGEYVRKDEFTRVSMRYSPGSTGLNQNSTTKRTVTHE